MLLGMPGTGKTMTTRMLALYFASKGYRIRYTTNGDIGDIKNALSSDKDKKEVILLDDCLGQHYFKMKEVKPGEVLGPIKYIAMNKQKMLIMNSRVTIFQEAKEQSVELKQFVEDERFRIKILDMTKLSAVDKGRILRNHLFAKEVPEEYYRNICQNRNYSKIVQHKNFTPRIMEYVTRKVNYKDILPEKYYLFVRECLNNPKEIWRDEFTNRIRPEDRILLTTLYSLTETTIEVSRLRRAFQERIRYEVQIDTSRYVWEDVLHRLEGAFIILIDWNRRQEISVLNPSVNDSLKEYLEENVPERENISRYAVDVEQIERGFTAEIKELLETGRIMDFYFEDEEDIYNIVVNGICNYRIFHERYKEIIRRFMYALGEKVLFYVEEKEKMFAVLLSEDFDRVYDTRQNLDRVKMKKILMRMTLEDFEPLIHTAKIWNVDFLYEEYGEEIEDALFVEIRAYADAVEATDYLGYWEIQDAVARNLVVYEDKIDIDEEALEERLVEDMANMVRKDMRKMVKDLPKPLGDRVRDEIEETYTSTYGVSACIEDFWKNRNKKIYVVDQKKKDTDTEEALDEIFR